MTLEVGQFIGPRIADDDAYEHSGNIVIDTANGRIQFLYGATVILDKPDADTTPTAGGKDYFWLISEDFVVDEHSTAGVDDRDTIISYRVTGSSLLELVWRKTAAGKFVIQLEYSTTGDIIAETSTVFDFGTVYGGIRLTAIGTTDQVALEIAGIVELNVTWPVDPLPLNWDLQRTAIRGTSPGELISFKNLVMCQGDSGDDRPAVDSTVHFSKPATGPGTYDDWTNAAAEIDDWSDLSGTHDSATTMRVAAGSASLNRFTEVMTDIVGVNTIRAVKLHIMHSTDNTTKNPNIFALLLHSGTLSEIVIAAAGTAWISEAQAIYNDVPGGSGWTDAQVDALEAGASMGDTTLGTKHRVTALALEIYDVATDAGEPPSLGVPRSFGVIIG